MPNYTRWEIAEQFGTIWNFYNILGALDGKHIAIECPKKSVSLYFSHKGFHSIALMALVDAVNKFIWVDIWANGSVLDAAIFNQSELKEVIENGTIGILAADPLPNDDRSMPYLIFGTDAFPLRT